ncbi:unnamed protein product [Ixodes persulcatus]
MSGMTVTSEYSIRNLLRSDAMLKPANEARICRAIRSEHNAATAYLRCSRSNSSFLLAREKTRSLQPLQL